MAHGPPSAGQPVLEIHPAKERGDFPSPSAANAPAGGDQNGKSRFSSAASGREPYSQNLEGLGGLHRPALLLAVPLGEPRAAGVGPRSEPHAEALGDKRPTLRLAGRDLVEVPLEPGDPLAELGVHRRHRVDLLLQDVVRGDHDVRLEGEGLLEVVDEVEEDRIPPEGRRVGAEVRDRDHERRVADGDRRVAVIRVVIVRPVGEDDVGPPRADEPHDLPPDLERRLQLAVVVVEDLGLDPVDAGGGLHFGLPALRQRPSRHPVVADVAVCDRDELHLVAEGRPLRRDAASVELAVVGVGPEGDNPDLPVLRRGHRGGIEIRLDVHRVHRCPAPRLRGRGSLHGDSGAERRGEKQRNRDDPRLPHGAPPF